MELLVLSFNIIHINLASNIFFSYSPRLVNLRQLLSTKFHTQTICTNIKRFKTYF